MKIRITGTAAELNAITEAIKDKQAVKSISEPYKNRGSLTEYRLYIDTNDLQPEEIKNILAGWK